jgi:1-pyrroline-5-carboxylate dehydrogenase
MEKAKQDPNAEIWVGGECDKSKGYFVQPTVIEAKDPLYVTMCEEIFGPVLTVYIYQPGDFEKTLELVTFHFSLCIDRLYHLSGPSYRRTGSR